MGDIGGGMGGPRFRAVGRSCLPSDLCAPVLAGSAQLELVVDIDVFESSVQSQHGWIPERGDFKVLWRGQIRANFP